MPINKIHIKEHIHKIDMYKKKAYKLETRIRRNRRMKKHTLKKRM